MPNTEMDERVKEVLAQLVRSDITYAEAAERLDLNLEQVQNLLDDYDHVPSGREVKEARRILKEAETELWSRLQKESNESAYPSIEGISGSFYINEERFSVNYPHSIGESEDSVSIQEKNHTTAVGESYGYIR